MNSTPSLEKEESLSTIIDLGSDTWHIILKYLNFEFMSLCFRVCQNWKNSMERWVDHRIISLCFELSKCDPKVVWERIVKKKPLADFGAIDQVRIFISKYKDNNEGCTHSPYIWLDLISALPPNYWMRSAAITTRSSLNLVPEVVCVIPASLQIQGSERFRLFQCASKLISNRLINNFQVFDIDCGKKLHSIPKQGEYGNRGVFAISPHGMILATANYFSVNVRDLSTPSNNTCLSGHDLENTECICQTFLYLNHIRYDVDAGCGVCGHRGLVTCLAFSPDSTLLASGSFDREVKIWDTSSWRLIHTLRKEEPNSVISLNFSDDGKMLLVHANMGRFEIWEIPSFQRLLFIDFEKRGMKFSWSPDGEFLVIWAPSSTTLVVEVRGKKEYFINRMTKSLAWAPNSRTIALCDRAMNCVRVINIPQLDEVAKIPISILNTIRGLQWSPDGTKIAILKRSGSIEIYDTVKWGIFCTLNGHLSSVTKIKWLPDSRRIVSTDCRFIIVSDVFNARECRGFTL